MAAHVGSTQVSRNALAHQLTQQTSSGQSGTGAGLRESRGMGCSSLRADAVRMWAMLVVAAVTAARTTAMMCT